MEVTRNGVETIGLINTSKKILSVYDKILERIKNKGDSPRMFRSPGRDNEVFRINPAVDVNSLRQERADLQADIERMEDALFRFNGRTTINGQGETVAEAMRKLRKLDAELETASRELQDTSAGMVVEGDDEVPSDFSVTRGTFLAWLGSYRYYKDAIAVTNSTATLTFEIKSDLVKRFIAEAGIIEP